MSHEQKDKRKCFGPFFSKIYSFFSSILPSSRRFYGTIAEDINCTDGSRVLDIGCGAGHLIHAILSRNPGVNAFGTDPSLSMIKIARKRIVRNGKSAEFSTGNCMSVPFEGSFDYVVSSSSYHHWDDQHACLENLAGRLNKNGSLRIYEYHSGEENGRSSRETHSLSSSEASGMSIEGYSRNIRIIGNIIAVTFQKEDSIKA